MWDHEKIFVLVSPSYFSSCVVSVDHKYQQASPAGTKRRSQVTGQVTGHRSQVTGHRAQGTGHRSQVTGYRAQVIGHRKRSKNS